VEQVVDRARWLVEQCDRSTKDELAWGHGEDRAVPFAELLGGDVLQPVNCACEQASTHRRTAGRGHDDTPEVRPGTAGSRPTSLAAGFLEPASGALAEVEEERHHEHQVSPKQIHKHVI